MEASYKFSFEFFPEKLGIVSSDIVFPPNVKNIGPQEAQITQIIAAYALHLAGVVAEKTGTDYEYGIEKSIANVEKFFSDAQFEVFTQ